MTRKPYSGQPDDTTRRAAHTLEEARLDLDAAFAAAHDDALRLRAEGVPIRTIAAWLGVSPATITTWTRKDQPMNTVHLHPRSNPGRPCDSLAHVDEAPPATTLVTCNPNPAVTLTAHLCDDCAASLRWELGQQRSHAA